MKLLKQPSKHNHSLNYVDLNSNLKEKLNSRYKSQRDLSRAVPKINMLNKNKLYNIYHKESEEMHGEHTIENPIASFGESIEEVINSK